MNLPVTPKTRGLFDATVVSNEPICRAHFRLVLSVAGFPPSAPGQFVQLNCDRPRGGSDEPDLHAWQSESDPGLRTRSLTAPLPLLRRPFSLAGDRPDPDRPGTRLLEIIGRAVGLGTNRLARLGPADTIDLIGPLGNRFPMPGAGQTALLVGGGVGIPPMIYLAEAVTKAGLPAVALAGVTTSDLLPLTPQFPPPDHFLPTACVREFARYNVPTVVASDDGTVGIKGFATDALAGVLGQLALPPDRLVVYTCGPERMMRAVSRMGQDRGIRVWVAMERSMACGIGTCQSCVCKVRARDAKPQSGAPADEWTYKLVCTDGPVFDGREIIWE